MDLGAFLLQSSPFGRRGIPDGNYGDDTAQAVSEFQAVRGLNPTGILDAATLRLLDQSFPPFSIRLQVFDQGGNPIGPVTLDISFPSPPVRMGTWRWPAGFFLGMTNTLGDWKWRRSGQFGTSLEFKVELDAPSFLAGPIELMVPSSIADRIWRGKPGQPVPFDPWFPKLLNGSGFDFRKRKITWTLI
jgi:hypothetical protein